MSKKNDLTIHQIPSCHSCHNLLSSDSSQTGFRCGLIYFSLPPRERKPIQYRHYPEVMADDRCPQWRIKS